MMEQDYLMLSGIQHFAFCPRQWALTHIENQWEENWLTADGKTFHRRADGSEKYELRGDILTVRGLRVFSDRLGISGVCDVVEFHRSDDGIPIKNYSGTWIPYPVEYKRGMPKMNQEDELQLCAQAVCLSEMLAFPIREGALFYGEPRRRQQVFFSDELIATLEKMLQKMHEYFERGYTPKIRKTAGCGNCSLKDICMPALENRVSVDDYVRIQMCENEK